MRGATASSIVRFAILCFARFGLAFVPSLSRPKAAATRSVINSSRPTPFSPLSAAASSSEASSGGGGGSTAAVSSLFRKGKSVEEDQGIFVGSGINGDTSYQVLQQQQQAIQSVENGDLSAVQSALTRVGMLAFIVGMCIALPLTLLPQKLLLQLGLVDRVRSERNALSTGRFCTRWLLRLIPFAKLEAIVTETPNPNPEPAVWVCNHQSMLDVFFLMAADRKLRGKNKRPIKIIYWKGLEDNPVTKLLFQQCGFIPVAMAANKPGEANQYDAGSFKQLLKGCKQAFDEGFDVALLPEGQLNPHPERGLLPTFAGAHTLARMARRPIHMMALHGTHHLWHPHDGMVSRRRRVRVRNYHAGEAGRSYKSADEFTATFERVVGHFGTTGQDLAPAEELEAWLSGTAWEKNGGRSEDKN